LSHFLPLQPLKLNHSVCSWCKIKEEYAFWK
jgi:hypothetical protein